MRARTVTTDLERLVVPQLVILRAAVTPESPEEDALVTLECFVAVALKLMAQTNPSKVRDVAMVSEIRWRLDALESKRC